MIGLINKADNAVFGGTLLAAGVFPHWFTSDDLVIIYYCLLIPPAAWHAWLVVKKAIDKYRQSKKE